MTPELRWHVPIRLDQVPEGGLHLDLVVDPALRAALAQVAGLRELPRLEAAVDLDRAGAGLRATGRVSATVGQNCVITLEPMMSEVDEAFEVAFAPAGAPDPSSAGVPATAGSDEPEALVDGVAELGAVLTEFLLLGIERYPRKPGAVFAPPAEFEESAGPFAILGKPKDPSPR